jgi:predicted transposase/invertase (TIGR01784 family)
MKTGRPLVSFDWAVKRLLRNKANFEVVEGFLSELLMRDIKIINVLESESDQSDEKGKHNRVDVLVEDESKEVILIEIQFSPEAGYFQRMLYGVSKAITDRMNKGNTYKEVKKIYSVNIVYFELGQGEDYVYLGRTDFRGLHKKDLLELSQEQREKFGKVEPGDIYPEYYVLKINHFDDNAKDTLDQWIYFLKHDKIEDNFTAKGLLAAREALDYYSLSEKERAEYDSIMDARESYFSHIESIEWSKNKAIEEQNKAIEKQNKAIEEQKKTIEEKDKTIEEKDKAIEEKDKTIEEKDKAIEEQKRTFEEQKRTFEEQKRTFEEQKRTLEEKEKSLEAKDKENVELRKTLAELERLSRNK